MTIQNPALYLTGESHPADSFRRRDQALLSETGVLLDGDFLVTENGTPNMSVNVAEGQAFVVGGESSVQGVYFVEAQGVENLAVTAADATNPRWDIVGLKVEDGDYSGSTWAASLVIVDGTAAASPTDPTLPDNFLSLARVVVSAAATSITNADITDLRTDGVGLATSVGGVIPTTSTGRPASPRDGQPIFESDSNKIRYWDGSAWTALATESVIASAVPSGLISMWGSTTAPVGWLLLDGSVVATATYPDLAAAYPAWVSGANITLPDMRGRVAAGYDSGDAAFNTMGGTGGSKTRSLSKANLPTHNHTINHGHADTFATANDTHSHSVSGSTNTDSHSHTVAADTGTGFVFRPGSAVGFGVPGGSTHYFQDSTSSKTTSSDGHSHTLTGTAASDVHNHSITGSVTNHTGNSGNGSADGLSGSAFDIMQPYLTLNFIVKT